MEPRTTITRDEVSLTIQTVRDHIPNDTFEQFIDHVYTAIEIYLDSDEPSIVTKELREINRICQKPNYTILKVLENVSSTTRKLLEGSNLLDGSKPLPAQPNPEDAAGINAFCQELRQRLIIRMKPLSDRKGYHLIGPSKAYRPPQDRLSVLVSFVATAYVSATGKTYRRQWDSDSDLPFNQILGKLFEILCIDASVDEAIRRQKHPKRKNN
ncbi:MAG: hypothetical protein HOL33_03150 [Tateyamaria sp.]|nr:hypothetical protein [Tateyamaria sp.]